MIEIMNFIFNFLVLITALVTREMSSDKNLDAYISKRKSLVLSHVNKSIIRFYNDPSVLLRKLILGADYKQEFKEKNSGKKLKSENRFPLKIATYDFNGSFTSEEKIPFLITLKDKDFTAHMKIKSIRKLINLKLNSNHINY